jgi:hypothetical protein
MENDRNAAVSVLTEHSDADMVLSILGELEEKMQFVGDKVDQIQLEEKKHYESLRRGLRRLKEDKPIAPVGPNANGVYPCCICNYCLKSTYPLSIVLILANVVTYVICDSCENFTLCVDCFLSDKYAHHPGHGFSLKNPDSKDTPRLKELILRLGPGRGLRHRAHCDECKQVFSS